MNEEEAKAKWCPFTRVGEQASGAAENRPDGSFNCIASACMAWRVTGSKFRDGRNGRLHDRDLTGRRVDRHRLLRPSWSAPMTSLEVRNHRGVVVYTTNLAELAFKFADARTDIGKLTVWEVTTRVTERELIPATVTQLSPKRRAAS